LGRTGLEEPVLGSAPAPPVSRRCKLGASLAWAAPAWKSRCWEALQHRLFHGGASWGRVSHGLHRPGRAGAGKRSSTACFTAVQVRGEFRMGRTGLEEPVLESLAWVAPAWKSRCWKALQHRLFHGGASWGRVSHGSHRPGRAGAGKRSNTACFTAVQVRGEFRVGRTGLEEPVLGSAPAPPSWGRVSRGPHRPGRAGAGKRSSTAKLGASFAWVAPAWKSRCWEALQHRLFHGGASWGQVSRGPHRPGRAGAGKSRVGRTGLEEPVLENAAGQVCRPASRKRLIKPWRRLYWSRIWLTCSSKADCRFWYSARCLSFFNSPTASS